MTKKQYIDWLTRLNEKIHNGDTFTGGELKGKKIRSVYSRMTLAQLREEFESHCC